MYEGKDDFSRTFRAEKKFYNFFLLTNVGFSGMFSQHVHVLVGGDEKQRRFSGRVSTYDSNLDGFCHGSYGYRIV